MPATPLMNARVPSDLRDAIERLAGKAGVSVSDIMRSALTEYVEHQAEAHLDATGRLVADPDQGPNR